MAPFSMGGRGRSWDMLKDEDMNLLWERFIA